MQSIKLFMEHGLGFSYRCGPIAKMPTLKKSPFDDIPPGVQSKIVKNMFLLTLYGDECTYECSCDFDHDCTPCFMHKKYANGSSVCKVFRWICFDKEKVEKHILSNVAVKYGLQHIKEFLDIVHQHDKPILGRNFDLKTIYSVPPVLRSKVLEPQSPWLFFKGYTQEEYELLKRVSALKGTTLLIMPENRTFILGKKIQKFSMISTLGGVVGTGLTHCVVPDMKWIPLMFFLAAGGTCVVDTLVLRMCRDYNPESWELKKVTL